MIDTDGRRHRLIEKGVIAPRARSPLPERLRHIHDGIAALIAAPSPRILAVEDIFHAVNTRSALVLAHVRGVVLAGRAREAGLPVHAFSPATVKAQVTGYGRAEKTPGGPHGGRLLELPGDGPAGDATDALAVALCQRHLHAPGRGADSA